MIPHVHTHRGGPQPAEAQDLSEQPQCALTHSWPRSLHRWQNQDEHRVNLEFWVVQEQPVLLVFTSASVLCPSGLWAFLPTPRNVGGSHPSVLVPGRVVGLCGVYWCSLVHLPYSLDLSHHTQRKPWSPCHQGRNNLGLAGAGKDCTLSQPEPTTLFQKCPGHPRPWPLV